MQDRVFGIETEYAIIWHPRGKSAERPTNLEIYRRIEAALERRVRSLPEKLSLRTKGGRFLENGGTFQYEARPDDFQSGLLELASPECRDPDTLVAHERAKDALAEELAAEAGLELERAGWRGELRLGKNNVDSAGHTFGSHESYWVEDRLPPGSRALFLPLWLALWVVSAPIMGLVVATPWLVMLALLAAGLVALGLGALARPIWPSASAALFGRIARFTRSVERDPGVLARRLNWITAPLKPLLALHSAVYARFHLRAIRRDLTAFLATRAVFAGAGAVSFGGGGWLRVAQRAPFLRTEARIFPEGELRPLYELRDLFFRPRSALGSRRRLHLLLGDANLCDWALWLRVASTALVLEAIEAEPEGWPVLARPLEALRVVGADPELRARLQLADGSSASALEIQRSYLARVEAVLERGAAERAGWKRTALSRWRETLALLERDPERLADRIDWIAKRALVQAEVPQAADREALAQRGAELVASAQLEAEAQRLRALAFRAWRADLRYHELGPRGGFRRLESRGKIRRLADPDAVSRARSEPPADTRAAARGRAIRWAAERGVRGSASWERVRLAGHGSLDLADPLDPQRGAE
jgi:proteasome accessory factor A